MLEPQLFLVRKKKIRKGKEEGREERNGLRKRGREEERKEGKKEIKIEGKKKEMIVG